MRRTPYVPCGSVFVLVAILAEIMQQTITFFFILFFRWRKLSAIPFIARKGKFFMI